MSDDDADDDRVVRTVEDGEGSGRVSVPEAWVGARVEVVRTGPGEPDRADYAVDAADDTPAFAARVDGEPYAGPDVVEHLRRGAADPAGLYVGLAEDGAGAYHATVDPGAIADGLAVLGDGDPRASALLGNLAHQAAAGGAGAAVLDRGGATAERFARALPEDRAADLRVVGGARGGSVNLLDPGVEPSSAAFFDAIDATTDALVSLLVVVAPQLRDAVREFVMTTASHGDTSLPELRELVRYGLVGDDADVPPWVTEESPDLLDRVAGVDEEAIEWLLASMEPLLAEPARSLLADPDPDVRPVDVVRSRDPLVVQVDDADAWPTVGRALVHSLWGAAREFVPEGEAPYYVVGDGMGPALDAESGLDKLFARLHRDPITPVLGVDPAAVGDDAWADLGAAVGAHATFGLADPGARERAAALTGLDAEQLATLPAGGFWLTGVDEPRRHLGYHPAPPERPREALDWLA